MFNWNELKDEEYGFDSDVKLIQAIEQVTKERLLACFNTVLFTESRRMNVKVHSHAHRDDTETRQASQDLNR